MGKPTVFAVSDDAVVVDSIKVLVESTELEAEGFPSLQAFLDAVEPGIRGCLVLDARARDLNDREWLVQLTVACSSVPCLLLTDRGDVPMAVLAVKAGAMDVVQKPYRNRNLLDGIKKALQLDAAAHD